MRDHAGELLEQTHIWRDRLLPRLAACEALDEQGEAMLRNIRAYEADSRHFEEMDDRVRAFECVLWAWAWIEIGEDLGHLTPPTDGAEGTDDA